MAYLVEKTQFLDPTYSDWATLHGTAVSTLPLVNLQDRDVANVYRTLSVDVEDTKFDIEFLAAMPIDLFVLAGIATYSPDALIKLTAATTQGGLDTPAFTFDWRSVWPSTGKPTELGWQSFVAYISLGGAQNYKWWRVEIDDHDNPLGYLDTSRMVFGKIWEPFYNVFWSLDMGTDSYDLAVMTPYGNDNTSERGQVRSWLMPFDFMKKEDADQLEIYSRIWGTAKDFFVVVGPVLEADAHRNMMMARLLNKPRLSPVNRVANGMKKSRLDVVEIVQ